ncbi:MAG: tRNA (adenosine(37)-N6)-threonylcarbamoyltransferase complex ATPase subunit type 1 TsaE [Victivallales bacterium]|nr:tRNA (adenosine(37)-N6)-threonylcarbamoyltransferase complex ATPase subunit type 1 TsaE [Victivallales bacterium]
MEYLTTSEEMTLALGERLAGLLSGGCVVALEGDLGCGKTVLSRGIARGLGVTEAVTSPTFTVAQEYRLPDGRFLYHLDMYRISDETAALAFGIDEFLFQPNAITLVEWPGQIAGLLVGPRLRTIHFRHGGEGIRALSFEGWPDACALTAVLDASGLAPSPGK